MMSRILLDYYLLLLAVLVCKETLAATECQQSRTRATPWLPRTDRLMRINCGAPIVGHQFFLGKDSGFDGNVQATPYCCNGEEQKERIKGS